jgi:hypothetical protein
MNEQESIPLKNRQRGPNKPNMLLRNSLQKVSMDIRTRTSKIGTKHRHAAHRGETRKLSTIIEPKKFILMISPQEDCLVLQLQYL